MSSIRQIFAEKENYKTVAEDNTPIFVINAEIEDCLDEMEDSFSEMEDCICVTNQLEMEGAYYDAEGVLDTIKAGIKKFADAVKSVVDKIIRTIKDYITKVLDKLDEKWLEKNEEFITRASELKDSVKIKSKSWLDKNNVEATIKILEDANENMDDFANAVAEGKEILDKSSRKAVEMTTKEMNEAMDISFITKAGEKSKDMPVKKFGTSKYVEIWKDGRKDKNALNDAIKQLEAVKKNVAKIKVDTDLEGNKAKYAAVALKLVKKTISILLTESRYVLTLVKERRSALKAAFGMIISEVKKLDAKEKEKNK